MTTTPKSPMAIALQRRARTRSPRRSAASTVAKSGAVKLSAVAVASGTSVMPMNHVTIETKATPARRVKKPILAVRRLPRPRRAMNGTMKIRLKRLRKNTTSSGCNSAAASRMTTFMMPPVMPPRIIQIIAWMIGGSAARGGRYE